MIATTSDEVSFGDGLSVAKMPAHWLMARMGKRVLRPGGVEMTRWLLTTTNIEPTDNVIEFAPGLGHTARAILARLPASYLGVERDPHAAELTERALRRAGLYAPVLQADASRVPVDDENASVIIGEAMLSMQSMAKKRAIIGEARRVLRPGGRYAIHELAVGPDTIDRALVEEIQRDLSRSIHVGVRIGTVAEWKEWLREGGFTPELSRVAPMRLLELDRLVSDEGLVGTARLALHVLRTPGAARRLKDLRAVFRKHAAHLHAVAIVARRSSTREVCELSPAEKKVEPVSSRGTARLPPQDP